jgi:C-terminal processing protease CtpA/Prc
LNRVGVTPDVVVDTTPADLANQHDVQLAQAVELLLRR